MKKAIGEQITEAVLWLEKNGIIGYPTETVYGLGGYALSTAVLDRIYGLKGRGTAKPFPVLVGRPEDLASFVSLIPPVSLMLMERFWPGPLTLVFEASPRLPEPLVGKSGKIGVRISSDPVCRELLRRFGKPLISTSANPGGKEPARSASELFTYFGESVDCIVDGGERSADIPSTVLDVTQHPPVILRRGSIGPEDMGITTGEVNDRSL